MTPDNSSTIIADEEALSRTWQLVSELCSQLANNRNQIQSLEQQVTELRNRANEFTGPLIRASIRAPPFESGSSEIERQNLRLIYENQQLNEENAALSLLVKEYETTLQVVMSKFRIQAHEIQQSKLQMQREYEIMLEEETQKTSKASLENAELHSHLSIIGTLVRQAYDFQSDLDTEILLQSLCIENQGLREMLRISAVNNALFQDEKSTEIRPDDFLQRTKTSLIDGLRSSNKNTISKRNRIIAEAEKEEEERELEAEEEKEQQRDEEEEEEDMGDSNGGS